LSIRYFPIKLFPEYLRCEGRLGLGVGLVGVGSPISVLVYEWEHVEGKVLKINLNDNVVGDNIASPLLTTTLTLILTLYDTRDGKPDHKRCLI